VPTSFIQIMLKRFKINSSSRWNCHTSLHTPLCSKCFTPNQYEATIHKEINFRCILVSSRSLADEKPKLQDQHALSVYRKNTHSSEP
jgi:hypothetical protein